MFNNLTVALYGENEAIVTMKIYCPNCFEPNEVGQDQCIRCRSVLEWEEEEYVDKLIRALDHAEPLTAVRAAEILGNFGEEKVAEALENVLATSQDPYLLKAAIASLGRMGPTRSMEYIITLLRNSYLIVRVQAAKTLGEIGTELALEALEEALGDGSKVVRQEAKRALEKLFRKMSDEERL